MTPREHAEVVRALPGQKPLRVGVVVLTDNQRVRAAASDLAAPAAEMAPTRGVRYCEHALLPDSLPEDSLVEAIADLGAFTDVMQLPFDSRGIASRDALLQRVQDRLWPTAAAQELDALLLVEGIADRGLAWSDADESLLSLDTVLWWLTWPFGVLIRDRAYAPDVTLVATLYSPHDQRTVPVAVDASATADATELPPWDRAATPFLGLVVPPALLADDPAAVSRSVGERTRAMLPIELVRRLKAAPFVDAPDLTLAVSRRDQRIALTITSAREVAEVTLTALPRGILSEPATPVLVPIATELEPTPEGARYRTHGQVATDAFDASARPLLRARITFGPGEVVSRTFPLATLE